MPARSLFFLHVPFCAGDYVISVALKHELRQGPFLPQTPRYRGRPDGRLHYGGKNRVRRKATDTDPSGTRCVQWAPGWDDGVRFAVVRNPFSVLLSMFHASAPPETPRDRRSFLSFLQRWADDPQPDGGLFASLFDEDGSCPLDQLLHAEHLDDGLQRLTAPLGIQPRRGPTPPQRDHRAWYTDPMRELVERVCAPELAWTGYDFDGLRAEVAAA